MDNEINSNNDRHYTAQDMQSTYRIRTSKKKRPGMYIGSTGVKDSTT